MTGRDGARRHHARREHDDEGRGGNATDFGANRMAAHWMALAALIALALLLARTLRAQREPAEDQ